MRLLWSCLAEAPGQDHGDWAGEVVGTNASLIVYTDGDPRQVLRSSPAMDRPAARDLVRRLFPEHAIEETGDADLMDVLSPDLGRAYAGCYPGLAILCHSGLGRDRPSGLPQHILGARPYRWIYLIAMISFFDCAAVAAWHDGQLRRSLSVTFNGQLADPPVTGEIVENIGDPLPFEQPLWARHSPHGEQRIPFHPSTLERPRSQRFSAFLMPGACLTPSNTAPSASPGSASPPCPARLPKPKNAKPKQQHGAPSPRSG